MRLNYLVSAGEGMCLERPLDCRARSQTTE